MGTVALADEPWPLIMLGCFILFTIVQDSLYRRIDEDLRGKTTSSPGAALLGIVFGAVAFLLRGTAIVPWAGPLLGVITFIGLYVYLRWYGFGANSPE
ncbi:hypothetical protein AB6813_13155 [bacterium RCC_150]